VTIEISANSSCILGVFFFFQFCFFKKIDNFFPQKFSKIGQICTIKKPSIIFHLLKNDPKKNSRKIAACIEII